MKAHELLLDIADTLHDWDDGDDPVVGVVPYPDGAISLGRLPAAISVCFESGSVLVVEVKEIENNR